MNLKLNDFSKFRAFMTQVYKIPWDIPILLLQDNYTVDARRSLGILSLDLDRPVRLELVTTDGNVQEVYLPYFDPFEEV